MTIKLKKNILDLAINISVTIFMLCLIITMALLMINSMNDAYLSLPPTNSTDEWKVILNSSHCPWYQIGCQKLACVIDCEKINENAGEIICVC